MSHRHFIQKQMRRTRFSQRGAGPIDLKSARAILTAVGRERVNPNVDMSAMVRGINLCCVWYQEARFFSTKRAEKVRMAYLNAVYKKAKALDILLAKPDVWSPVDTPTALALTSRAALKRLFETIDREQKATDRSLSFYGDSFKLRSPFEWLVAYFLPDVFFLLEIAPVSSSKELISQKSPYVYFAQAVLIELRIGVNGKPYSAGSIIKALRNRFTGQLRRKQSKEHNDLTFWRIGLLRSEMGLPLSHR
jgi:hypothetical protein